MDIKEIDWERFKNPDPDNVSVTFTESGRLYQFHHSRKGYEWRLSELSGAMPPMPAGIPSIPGLGAAVTRGLVPKVLRSGHWQRYYEVLIPFAEGGRNYLFAHSSQDNRWFISDLSAAWDGNSERKNGRWQRFYGSTVTFAENGRNYLLAHSRQDYRWFISDLSLAWDGSSEIGSGTFNCYCDSLLAFSRDGQNYIFGHGSAHNSWSLSRLTRGWNGHGSLKSGYSALRDMAALPEF